MIRILIADDHEIVRRAVRQLLEGHGDWEVCGEAATGNDAIRLADQLRPDVAILDLSMPGGSGVEAIRQIRQILPNTKVIVFSMHDTNELTRHALAAGAHAYLLKSDSAAHLEPAIEALLQNKGYFTPGIAATLANAIAHGFDKPPSATHDNLTAREREILRMLAQGISNKMIARQLDLSVATVQTHRSSIMRKLNVTSIAGLVRYAVRHGIVDA